MKNNNFLIRIEKLVNAYPQLEDRIESILNIVENTSGDLLTADQAEMKAIEEIQKLGQEVLKDWALQRHEDILDQVAQFNPKAKSHKKKALLV